MTIVITFNDVKIVSSLMTVVQLLIFEACDIYNTCRVKHALLSNKFAGYYLIILIELCIKNNARSKTTKYI